MALYELSHFVRFWVNGIENITKLTSELPRLSVPSPFILAIQGRGTDMMAKTTELQTIKQHGQINITN